MDEPPPNREKQPDVIDAELLALLCCPKTRQPLTLAPREVVAQLDAAREMGRLRDCTGQTVQEPVEGGLVRADGTMFFPIRDGIPVLIAGEGVVLPLEH